MGVAAQMFVTEPGEYHGSLVPSVLTVLGARRSRLTLWSGR